MDKEKLEKALRHLHWYYGVVDNCLCHNYSPESLKKELSEINDSIDYLQELLDCWIPVVSDGRS